MPGIPGRGERIGSAFVRVFFTGDNSGIRDALDDDSLRADAEKSGEETGDSYNEGWVKKLREGLGDTEDVEKERGKVIKDENEKTVREVGQTWDKFDREFVEKMGTAFDEVGTKVEHLGNHLDKTSKQMTNLIHGVDFLRSGLLELDQELDQKAEAFDRAFGKHRVEDIQHIRDEVHSTTARFGDMHDGLDDIDREFRDIVEHSQEIETHVDRDRDSTRRFGSSINDAAHNVDRLADRFLRFAPTVGRLFGLGSRNNLLNFIGAVVKNLLTVPFLIFKAFTSIGKFFTERFTGAVSAAGEEANTAGQSFQKLAVSILTSLPEAIIIVIALVAATAALAQVLQAVASLISGIAAAIIALASSLSFALVGALAPLLGVIGPLGFGLGVIIAGFVGIKKNADFLKKNIKPLVDDFKSLGKAADDAFFNHAGPIFDNLHNLIDNLREPFRRVGAEFGKLAAAAQKNLAAPDSPFAKWLHLLNVQAPRQIHVLGVAFGHFVNGLAGLFIDLRRPVFQMDDAIRDLAKRFDDFVNSTAGRQKIQDFLTKASDATKRWFDFLGSVKDIIFDLLFSPSGLAAGNGILDELTNKFKAFHDLIRTTGNEPIFSEAAQGPGGGIRQPPRPNTPVQDPLTEFFAHGKQTAEDLGNIALALGQIFDEFDNPQGQRNLHDFLQLLGEMGRLAGPLGVVLSILNGIFNATLVGAIVKFPHQIGTVLGKIRDLFKPGGFGDLRNGLIIGVHLVGRDQVINALSNLADRARNIAGRVKEGVDRALSGIPGSFKRTFALAALAMIFPFPTAIGILVANIHSIPDRIRGLVHQFGTIAASWVKAILSPFDGIVGKIASHFDGLGAAITSAIGTAVIHFAVEGPTGLLNKLEQLSPGGFLASKLGIKFGAEGGLFTAPAFRLIGEAGPEALVPLDRPLSQVDPSVRLLSAIAQGIPFNQSAKAGTTVEVGGITINGHLDDPELIAFSVVNRIAARASLL